MSKTSMEAGTDRVRTMERTLVDGTGKEFRVRVQIDEGAALEGEIIHLANKARQSPRHRSATAAGGVLRVTLMDNDG